MDLNGTIIAALPEQSGVSQRTGNTWTKRTFVMELLGGNSNYEPRKVAFQVFDSGIPSPNIGDKVTMSFDVESHEYSGRWYTDVRCWRLNVTEAALSAAPTPAPSQSYNPAPAAAPQPQQSQFPF